jgi:hypothetical protein
MVYGILRCTKAVRSPTYGVPDTSVGIHQSTEPRSDTGLGRFHLRGETST